MPRKLPTACRYPGCPALTTERFCDTHTKTVRGHATDRVDVNWGLQQLRRFYKSPPWLKLRSKFLSRRENRYCKCGARATTVDHKVQISKGGAPLDERNLEGMCKTCHERKRQRESLAARGIYPDK